MKRTTTAAALILASLLPASALAASPDCKNTGSFGPWLTAFKKEAGAAGVTKATIARALDGMELDPGVISRDRKQGFFAQSFLDFQAKLATKNRVVNGGKKMEQLASIFAKAEKEFGVPGAVITAFWALESDFGAGMGKLSVLRSLATLAYDCRRGDMFRAELLSALKIIDRGDLDPTDMIGSWAGELGQTQFLPTKYEKYAIDYDGDGRRNLMRSDADVIGSTAAYIKSLGWRRGEPWLEEVRVPERLPWDKADLAVKLPRSQWAAWGVTRANGRALENDAVPASLVLPMGRNGPAFLAFANFDVYVQWNESLTYSLTAAYLATRLAGAGPISRGRAPVESMSLDDLKRLQTILVKLGYDVGKIDGIVGAKTRAAVKAEQIKHKLPADAYPTAELLARIAGQ
jgi:lytic murein transglycosylase